MFKGYPPRMEVSLSFECLQTLATIMPSFVSILLTTDTLLFALVVHQLALLPLLHFPPNPDGGKSKIRHQQIKKFHVIQKSCHRAAQ